MDMSQRQGNYPVPPQAGPILGVEFAGVIEKTCRHCTPKLRIGVDGSE